MRLSKRWHDHMKHLNEGVHHSRYLQRAWRKYGEEAFGFSIIEEVDDSILLNREQWHIDQRKSLPRRLTYNVCWTVGSQLGTKRTAASKKRMAAAHKGISLSDDTRRKVADTWVERYGRVYSLRGPDGTLYEGIRNLRRFAREHNVHPQGLRTVVIGLQKVHKGWSLPDYMPVMYVIVSPSGQRFTGILELKEFCRQHGLNYKSIHRAMQRKKSSHGWIVSTVDDQRRRKGAVK